MCSSLATGQSAELVRYTHGSSQSVFQRRADLATVLATTAAGSGAYVIRDVGTGAGLDAADAAMPGMLAPFLERTPAPDPVAADRAVG